MTCPDAAHLAPTYFLDANHEEVRAFTASTVGAARTSGEKARRLFTAVRDEIWYDPYSVSEDPQDYRASAVLASRRAYCVPKAVLLTTVCRAAGIPARLGFADVRNHLQTDSLRELMSGSDLFVYHGYSSLFLEGKWVKATPAFNTELCSRFGVPPVEFDGTEDALMHAFTADGTRHMEYERDRGVFDDLPLPEILAELRRRYGPLVAGATSVAPDSFSPEDVRSLTSTNQSTLLDNHEEPS